MIAATEYFCNTNGNQTGKLFSDLTDQTGAAASISLDTQPGTVNYEYYQYDGFNRLTAYHTPTTAAEYTYNTQGLRIIKQSTARKPNTFGMTAIWSWS
jgi:YD repeat-containing protein